MTEGGGMKMKYLLLVVSDVISLGLLFSFGASTNVKHIKYIHVLGSI